MIIAQASFEQWTITYTGKLINVQYRKYVITENCM